MYNKKHPMSGLTVFTVVCSGVTILSLPLMNSVSKTEAAIILVQVVLSEGFPFPFFPSFNCKIKDYLADQLRVEFFNTWTHLCIYKRNSVIRHVKASTNPVFRATRPYLSEPADLRPFDENSVFLLGSL